MVSTKKQNFCRICHAACPVEVEIAENKVISVRGVKAVSYTHLTLPTIYSV